MTVTEMRTLISKVYTSYSWQKKVANMQEDQVIAVYCNFVKKGKFKQPPITSTFRPSERIMEPKPEPQEPKQLTIYDFIK